MLRFLIIALCVLLPFYAEAAVNMIFSNVYSTEGEPFYAVVVEKDHNRLNLLEISPEKTRLVKSFEVLTGAGNGDKYKQGDLKTPEGIYFVTTYLSPEKLQSMYGSVAKTYGTGAFPLNYPNILDIIRSKTGGGIWLHGVDDNREELNTKGCVAMENILLDDLKDYVKIGSPVIITHEADLLSPADYEKKFKNLKSEFAEFIEAWQNLDFETYKAYFHPDFKTRSGKTYDAFLNQKKYLMKIHPYRKITFDNLKIYKENESEYVYGFNQFYCSDNIISYGRKRLYFTKNNGSYKIITEEYSPSSANDIIINEARAFVEKWRTDWQSENIDEYISNYDENFRSDGMNIQAWRADKAEKFDRYQTISVQTEDVTVRPVSAVKYRVTFKQRFSADTYSDYGYKTLMLKGCPGDFKIISENWSAM